MVSYPLNIVSLADLKNPIIHRYCIYGCPLCNGEGFLWRIILKQQYMAASTYEVYVGGGFQKSFSNQEKAEKYYNSLPSGQGKSWKDRRMLVKETILKQDTRN